MVTVQLLCDAVGMDVVRRMLFFVFDSPDEFEALRAFRTAEAAKLGVELCVVPGPSKDALWRLHREHGLAAAVVGMRRADPSGAWLKSNVTPCTDGWPPMTLYLPVLDWDVPHVWDFTRARGVPFCSLYAQGYTSLGPRHETTPNPALEDPACPGRYRPAWELRESHLERASRASSRATDSVRPASVASSGGPAKSPARSPPSPTSPTNEHPNGPSRL